MSRRAPALHPAAAVALVAARIAVSGVFLYACYHKLLYPAQFAKVVYAYRILPLPLVNPFAEILPWVEAIAAVLLLFGVFPRSSSATLAALTAVFLAAIFVTKVRGLQIDCGCFSVGGGSEVSWGLFGRDIILLFFAALLAMLPQHPLTLVSDHHASEVRGC
jgi:putative oxidoreductase